MTSIDGIKKSKSAVKLPKTKPKKVFQVSMDEIKKPVLKAALKKKVSATPVIHSNIVFTPVITQHVSRNSFRQKLPIVLSVLLLAIGFATGAWATSRTQQIAAEFEVETPATPIPLAELNSLGPVETVPNEVLFNLPLNQLEIYLEEVLKTPEMKEAEKLAVRKEKLKVFLEDYKSPFIEHIDTLAELQHWKLVLAISFAESGMGRRCKDNNCSGIGVAPGHPYWREYESHREWMIDLDSLLERRYKDWSLEKMNGVYVQPKNPNWLLATKQVLADLQEREIE
jgi:hypothetical protein